MSSCDLMGSKGDLVRRVLGVAVIPFCLGATGFFAYDLFRSKGSSESSYSVPLKREEHHFIIDPSKSLDLSRGSDFFSSWYNLSNVELETVNFSLTSWELKLRGYQE
jgi:hypothetical protein